MARFSALAASALLVSSVAAAGRPPMLSFPDQAAEISGASRLVSAYGLVTSTFRTVAHNKAVGGVPNSYHLLDRAIDIARRPGVTHQQIEAALKRAGYNLVESLDELDHSHFAFAPVVKPATAPPATQSTPAPPPSAPPVPQLAADTHGTLNLDLKTHDASGMQAAAPSR
jgi:hypothetical protein